MPENKSIIEELYERSMNRIFGMSANYLMTLPKKGMEKEFAREKEIAEFLAELL